MQPTGAPRPSSAHGWTTWQHGAPLQSIRLGVGLWVVVLLVAPVSACIGGADTVDPAAARAAKAAATAVATAPAAGQRTTESAAPTGVDYDLYVHCGIRYLQFQGRTYRLVRPGGPASGAATPVASVVTGSGYLHGTLSVVDDREVEFLVDDPTVPIDGLTLSFRVTTEQPPVCS